MFGASVVLGTASLFESREFGGGYTESLGVIEETSDGKELKTRVAAVPARRFVEAGGFARDSADQVSHVAAADLAAFDLDDDALGLAAGVVDEGDEAVNAFVRALLALLAGALAAIRASVDEGQGPPLELEAILCGQLAGDVFVNVNGTEYRYYPGE